MFSSLILDVAIGLVFVYFTLSLLCSVIVESVASLNKWRPKMLLKGITALIFAPQESSSWLKNLTNRFKRSESQETPEERKAKTDEQLKVKAANDDFLQAFYRSPLFLGQTPSYISSRSFVLALLETIKDHPEVGKTSPQVPLDSPQNIIQLVEALPPDCYVRKALILILELAGDHLDKALEGMEKWYDEAMDRVTGWYKRWSQVIALVVAFLVAFGLNADTFQIAKTLYSDQTVRAAVVNSAQELVSKVPPAVPSSHPEKTGKSVPPEATITPSGKVDPTPSSVATPPLPKSGPAPTPPAITAPQPGVGETKTSTEPQKKENPTSVEKKNEISPPTALEAQVKQIEKAFKLGIPLGWPDFRSFKKGICQPIKWLGILFTAFMAVMGSNFWFDLLNQLVNVRGSGKKPPSTVTEAKK